MQNILWKKLKQRIRRKLKGQGKLVWGITRLMLLSSCMMLVLMQPIEAGQLTENQSDELSTWFQAGGQMRGIYHKIYVCGEEIIDLHQLSYEDTVILAKQNPNWEITVDQAFTIIRFQEYVNDLSPYCKANAFFGMDEEGQFSLYDGSPDDEKIMRTFFQLNIPYLESKLPKGELEHLQLGIKVRDIDEYDSVLSTFNEYRLDRISQ